VISIQDEHQPQLDFEEAEHLMPFTFPEYQRDLMFPRFTAGVTDLIIVAIVYSVFVITTIMQMADEFSPDNRGLAIYDMCFYALMVIYLLLFMLSSSQTLGMKQQYLIVVTKDGDLLSPKQACLRGFGYLVSVLPLLLGFVWMLVDPEHLTWADKVSSTYV